jgi:hypothetical protein
LTSDIGRESTQRLNVRCVNVESDLNVVEEGIVRIEYTSGLLRARSSASLDGVTIGGLSHIASRSPCTETTTGRPADADRPVR